MYQFPLPVYTNPHFVSILPVVSNRDMKTHGQRRGEQLATIPPRHSQVAAKSALSNMYQRCETPPATQHDGMVGNDGLLLSEVLFSYEVRNYINKIRHIMFMFKFSLPIR